MFRTDSIRFATLTATAAILVTLAGCAGMSEQACLTTDWRTVGFEDGSLGRSEAHIANYRKACSEHGIAPDLEAYRAGHAQGVEVYCRPSNGFEVGHSGAVYQGVCPAGAAKDFLASYNSGRRLYELESALRSVEAQIQSNYYEQESIRGELTGIAASMVATETTAEQRIYMVSRTAELGRRYGELTEATKTLERQRANHERELRDYQQTLAAQL